MSAVPGPARRLWRNKLRLAAVSLLAATAVAASGLQTTSAFVLQDTLDEHWRGTYDILVTQRGKDPVTSGLLRSEALIDATTGRLSWADLELIRGLPGVAVAAPVAHVAIASTSRADPRVWLAVPVRPDASLESPQAFRVTVTTRVDDGTGPRDLAGYRVLAFAYQPSFSQIVFDETGAPLTDADGRTVYATHALADSPRLLSGDTTVPFTAGDYDEATGTIPVGLVVDPRPAASVVLVDPEAERALLGEAGAFLDPLIAAHPASRAPVIVSERAPTPIRMVVTVEEFDEVTPGAAGADAVERAQGTGFLQNGQIAPRLTDGAATTVVREFELDAAPGVAPFTDELLLLGAITPEQVDDTRARLVSATAPRSVQEGRYTVPASARDDGHGVELAARGYVSFGRYTEAPVTSAAPVGAVTEYAKLFGAVGSVRAGEQAFPPFESVGTYRAEELRAALGEASFMPLGGYDIPAPALNDLPLATSITGFGIPGTNDVAIGSFALLDDWGVDRPISSIRIRVAGAHDYTPEAQQRLLEAAGALATLGFTTTVVAGSSPQNLPVQVTGFATTEVDERGGQVVGELGTIVQRWSRLGSVVEVDAAVSATSIALLAASIVAVGVLLAVVQFGSVPGRRAQAAVLRRQGWRRGRIAGWFLAEESVALLGLAAVGAVAVALATVPLVAASAVAAAVVLVTVTSLIVVVAGARAPRHTDRRRRSLPAAHPPGLHGPIRFGARQARTQPVASVSLGIALALMAVFVGAGVAAFAQGRELAGPSSLGDLAFSRAGLPQGILAAVGLAAAILLAVLSRRASLRRRRAQWAAVRAMGWTRRDIVRAHFAELGVSAVPGALTGVALAGVVAAMGGVPALPVVATSTVVTGVAVAVVLVSGRRISWSA